MRRVEGQARSKQGGWKQKILVAPKGEGPKQLTSVCMCVLHEGGEGMGVGGWQSWSRCPQGALETGREQR